MDEYIKEISEEFNDLHEQNLNQYIEKKDKRRSLMTMTLYLLFFFLPTFLYVLIFLPIAFNNDLFFKDYTEEEHTFEQASNYATSLAIVNLDSTNLYEENYSDFLNKIYELNGYAYYINVNTPMLLTSIQETDYEYHNIKPEELITSILDGSQKTWPNGSEILIFAPKSDVSPDYLNSEIFDPLTLVEKARLETSLSTALFSFVVYTIFTGAAVIINLKLLKHELKLFNQSKTETLSKVFSGVLYVFLGNIIAGVLVTIISFIFSLPQEISANQLSINRQLSGGFAVLMIITAVFIGPILEELVFRKSFFSVIKNERTALIVSSLLFGLIHVTSELTSGNLVLALTSGLSYIAGGLTLGYVYINSKKNIYLVIIVHMAYNLIGILMNYLF